MICNYFTEYGDVDDLTSYYDAQLQRSVSTGSCTSPAVLRLLLTPTVCVCLTHAERIIERYPLLGTLATRFAPLEVIEVS